MAWDFGGLGLGSGMSGLEPRTFLWRTLEGDAFEVEAKTTITEKY